jgi:hypothetical protein
MARLNDRVLRRPWNEIETMIRTIPMCRNWAPAERSIQHFLPVGGCGLITAMQRLLPVMPTP